MILAALVVAAVVAVGYAAYKHYTLAQVKAEVAKIESEGKAFGATVSADVKATYAAVVARLKAVL
jgi:hypothetical protein